MSYVKSRKRQEFGKASVALVKSVVAFAPLLSHSLSGYINIMTTPAESTAFIAGVVALLDFCFIRYFFLDDLLPRKGQAGLKNSGWCGFSAGLYMTGVVAMSYVGIILFGAPIFDSVGGTIALSIFLAVAAFGPFNYIYMQPFEELSKFFQSDKGEVWCMEKACLLPGLAAVAGAWCGAVVIPLDWDRDWQKWPIPCCFGALLAYGVSNLIWSLFILVKYFERPSQKFTAKGE